MGDRLFLMRLQKAILSDPLFRLRARPLPASGKGRRKASIGNLLWLLARYEIARAISRTRSQALLQLGFADERAARRALQNAEARVRQEYLDWELAIPFSATPWAVCFAKGRIQSFCAACPYPNRCLPLTESSPPIMRAVLVDAGRGIFEQEVTIGHHISPEMRTPSFCCLFDLYQQGGTKIAPISVLGTPRKV